MVEVEILKRRATIVGREWVSGDDILLRLLRPDLRLREEWGHDPFPALTIAQEAIARYGGRIVKQEPPEHVAGRVY